MILWVLLEVWPECTKVKTRVKLEHWSTIQQPVKLPQCHVYAHYLKIPKHTWFPKQRPWIALNKWIHNSFLTSLYTSFIITIFTIITEKREAMEKHLLCENKDCNWILSTQAKSEITSRTWNPSSSRQRGEDLWDLLATQPSCSVSPGFSETPCLKK